MCAIAGMIGLTLTRELRDAMLRSMAHRGPDGADAFVTEDAALLHSRLAIIDPAGGAQPMILDWEGERYVLVYNGELYNTEELRRELTALGHQFKTRSDTEVVLHAYAAYGVLALLAPPALVLDLPVLLVQVPVQVLLGPTVHHLQLHHCLSLQLHQ